MTETELFARAGTGVISETAPGVTRRVLLHTDELMLVEFTFKEGAIGAPHSHPHVQGSYIAAGAFEVTIGESVETLRAGDSFIVPSDVVHGVWAVEAGTLIDSFTPHRADFIM